MYQTPLRRPRPADWPVLAWDDGQVAVPGGLLTIGAPEADGLTPVLFRPHPPAGTDPDEIPALRREVARGSRDWWWYAAMHPMGGSRIASFAEIHRGRRALNYSLFAPGEPSVPDLLERADYNRDSQGRWVRRNAGGNTVIVANAEQVVLRREILDTIEIRAVLRLKDRLPAPDGAPIFWPGALGKAGRLVELALAYEGHIDLPEGL